jgi:hypothetical protein
MEAEEAAGENGVDFHEVEPAPAVHPAHNKRTADDAGLDEKGPEEDGGAKSARVEEEGASCGC